MKVIIVGAGIGGLTTAIALQQRGIDYDIYDGAPGNRPLGAGIILGVNAMRVYEKLGISDAIKAAAVLPAQVNICTDTGDLLQSMRNASLESRYGIATYGIHRAALQDILLKYTKRPVQWGKRCIEVQEEAAGVAVRFEDGFDVRGGIVIGADGIRSTVREQYVARANYRYSGQTCWRAIVPIDLPAEESVTASEVWNNRGNGLRAMFMQVGPQQVYFWMTTAMQAGTQWKAKDALQYIRQQLAGFPGFMQTVLQQLTPEQLIHGDLYDLKPICDWYRGRVVLLGDAAHATTPNLGQGAGQAIEDAWALADCLASKGDYREAFINYQARRMKRARKIVQMSRQLAMVTNWKGRVLTSLRNGIMKSMPKGMMQKQLDFMYGVVL